MLKVNEKKLLDDHAELVDKRASNLEEIRAQALQYAAQRGYDEEKTERFIAYMQHEMEGDGLSADESARLELLASYIEEVEDPVEEHEGETSGEPCEEAATINNI